jgi:LacI family transcriptional regulator
MATIYDVAREAGVSPKTVSRVINGDSLVSAETRATVTRVIDSLNYVPSRAARLMRSQKSGLVGLITGAISSTPDQAEGAGLPSILVVRGIQRAFARHGLILLISDTGGQPERIPELVQTFRQHRVEGLVYVADYHQQVELPADFYASPAVLANCFDTRGTSAVVPDDFSGQHDLVAGLLAAGHRRIAYLTLPPEMVATGLRVAGYQQAHQAAACVADPALIVTGAHLEGDEYRDLAATLDRLLAMADPPTVLCCGNDKMALRVRALLRVRGKAIPEDIEVAGYDDYQLITEQLTPALTSVALLYDVIGERAAERLAGLIRDGKGTGEEAVEIVSGPVTWRASAPGPGAGPPPSRK